jgi:hypothetical protein
VFVLVSLRERVAGHKRGRAPPPGRRIGGPPAFPPPVVQGGHSVSVPPGPPLPPPRGPCRSRLPGMGGTTGPGRGDDTPAVRSAPSACGRPGGPERCQCFGQVPAAVESVDEEVHLVTLHVCTGDRCGGDAGPVQPEGVPG